MTPGRSQEKPQPFDTYNYLLIGNIELGMHYAHLAAMYGERVPIATMIGGWEIRSSNRVSFTTRDCRKRRCGTMNHEFTL